MSTNFLKTFRKAHALVTGILGADITKIGRCGGQL